VNGAMANLNHFAISAGLGSTLGPRVVVRHGQFGSAELAATIATLMERRKGFIQELEPDDDLTKEYEKGVRQAFLRVRQNFSSDRVLADPELNRQFIKACRDNGIDDDEFRLNLALIGLRKHNKLKAKSAHSRVANQWRYAVASEVAARVMFYRYGASVDTTLAHPQLVKEFDKLASSITPGYSSFEYRWAALNMRKKGANAKVKPAVIEELDWSKPARFDVKSLPSDEGVYTLFENQTSLFVAGTEDIEESIQNQKRIAEVPLFEPELWRPTPDRLSWQYVRMPSSNSDYRFGIVRALIGRWNPIFNIPRGKQVALH
jgi:hypothetical protein